MSSNSAFAVKNLLALLTSVIAVGLLCAAIANGQVWYMGGDSEPSAGFYWQSTLYSFCITYGRYDNVMAYASNICWPITSAPVPACPAGADCSQLNQLKIAARGLDDALQTIEGAAVSTVGALGAGIAFGAAFVVGLILLWCPFGKACRPVFLLLLKIVGFVLHICCIIAIATWVNGLNGASNQMTWYFQPSYAEVDWLPLTAAKMAGVNLTIGAAVLSFFACALNCFIFSSEIDGQSDAPYKLRNTWTGRAGPVPYAANPQVFAVADTTAPPMGQPVGYAVAQQPIAYAVTQPVAV